MRLLAPHPPEFWPVVHRGGGLLVLICALAMLGYAASVAADPGSHSIPPQVGTRMLRHANSDRGNSDHERGHDKRDRNHDDAQQRPAIAPEQAAQRARDRFGGRVLNVILEHGPGGPYYRVKLLKHGRVRVVDIDARR